MLFTKADDDVLQGEVDAGSDESRRDGQTADLDIESHFAERVVIEQDPTNVSEGLSHAAKTHGN